MAAQAVGVGHALVVEDPPHLVGLVAVDAGRQHVGLLLPQLALDDLAVHDLDLGVALGAGGRDVAPRDGRGRVGRPQDRVGRVAGGAVGGHDQALAQQPLAVNALRVVLQDVVLVDLAVALHRRPLAVAAAAHERHLQRRDRRARVLDRQDVVVAVAVLAARGQRVLAGDGLPVQRLGVQGLLVRVAGPAVDLLDRDVVGQLLARQGLVAAGALEAAVHRGRELLDQLLVLVAGQAVLVALGRGGRGERQPQPHPQQPAAPAHRRPPT